MVLVEDLKGELKVGTTTLSISESSNYVFKKISKEN